MGDRQQGSPVAAENKGHKWKDHLVVSGSTAFLLHHLSHSRKGQLHSRLALYCPSDSSEGSHSYAFKGLWFITHIHGGSIP